MKSLDKTFRHLSREDKLKQLVDYGWLTDESYDVLLKNPLINEEQATNRAQQVASEIVGFENVVTDHPKSLGADDFADYLAVIPGIYGRVGSRNPENPATHFGHHHEQFDIDERALLLAAEYHIRYALNYLSE